MGYKQPFKKVGKVEPGMKNQSKSGIYQIGALEDLAKKASSKLEKETGFGTKGFGESKKVEVLGSKLTNVPTYDKSAEERGLETGYKLLESSARGEGPYTGETMEVLKKKYTPEQAKQKLMSTPSARSTYEADVAFEKATGGLTIPQTGPAGGGFVTRKGDVAFQPHTISQSEFKAIAKKAGGAGGYRGMGDLGKESISGASGSIPGISSLITEEAKSAGRYGKGVRTSAVGGPEISRGKLKGVKALQKTKVEQQKKALEGAILKEQFRKKPEPVSITTKGLVNPMRK